MVQFESLVKQGGGKGTGFMALPEELSKNFQTGEVIKVNLQKEEKEFYTTIRKCQGLGFYLPKALCQKFELLRKNTGAQIEHCDGVYAKASEDGMVRIPKDAIKSHNLSKGNALQITIGDKKLFVELAGQTKNKNTLCFAGGKRFSGQSLLFQIDKKLNKLKDINKIPVYETSEDTAIIFDAKFPTNIKTDIKLENLALYLGAYLADGTKIGNSWAICASTTQQANFYLQNHKNIISEPQFQCELSYSCIGKPKSNLKENLESKWSEAGITIPKFRIRTCIGAAPLKHNRMGTLVIKENRVGVLNYYNYILRELVNKIIKTKNKELAIEFICGLLEGDGTVNAKKRGHIQIATNAKDYKIIEKILKITGIKYALVFEGENKGFFRIGALELIKYLPQFYPLIFKLYPKRRKALIMRLLEVGGVKFLLGRQKHASSWVKAELKRYGILDINYLPTKKGKTMIKLLKNMEKELPELNQYEN